MVEFKRIKQQNFYVAKVGNHTILKSYNTIVGIVIDNYELAEVKYSRTTSKQVTQYCNSIGVHQKYKYVNDCHGLHEAIKNCTGLDLDTRYNCA